MPTRSIIYIDGFNLYYGAIRGGPHKWLNLERFFRMLRPADDIQKIKYFTAKVFGPTLINQETYLRAIATLPLVNVIEGRYKRKQVKCGVMACASHCDRMFTVPEEKRTDVNIAVHMVDDAHRNQCDHFILISGDSDLVPALHCIKQTFPTKRVTVYVPARNRIRGAAVELRSAADDSRDLPLNLLKLAQFPAAVPDGFGGFIAKPATW